MDYVVNSINHRLMRLLLLVLRCYCCRFMVFDDIKNVPQQSEFGLDGLPCGRDELTHKVLSGETRRCNLLTSALK